MTIKVGINGFGRMGRLTLRAAWDWDDVEFFHINEPVGDAAALAHLLTFDSVHGCWPHEATAEDDHVIIGKQRISTSRHLSIAETDWSRCDVVIEASGKMKTTALLQTYPVSIIDVCEAGRTSQSPVTLQGTGRRSRRIDKSAAWLARLKRRNLSPLEQPQTQFTFA